MSEEKKEVVLAENIEAKPTVIKVKNSGGFIKGLIVGLIAGVVASVFVFKPDILSMVKPEPPTHTESETAQIIEEHFTGYTALDFEDAVVGKAEEKQELIVMEQPMQLTETITHSGLGDLAIFMKTKNITYHGTGIYTVDLKDISKDDIEVDNDKKTVTITVPHSTLKTVNPDYDKIEFEDTELGMFAIFDLTLTAEQQNEIEKSVMADMREMLSEDQYMKQADEFAEMKIWDTFQPFVTSVAPDYKLEIEFSTSSGQH